jgi:UDP-hydrolysing UDP-N-acetyl-D-glucosamine 2-epimerase
MKVLGISHIRSDYDLLSGVYRALQAKEDLEFQLIVGGAHLSSTFGNSVQEIKRDGLSILVGIQSLIDSDFPSARAKTAAVFMQSEVDAIASYKPDVVLYAGDREDTLATAIVCAYLKIPTIHFFGGQHATDGNVDNPVRHAISKLSTFHFVTNSIHRDRLLSLGEPPERIYVVGSPAIDKFRTEAWLSRRELFDSLQANHLKEISEYAVLIYHPILGEEQAAASEVRSIFEAVLETDLHLFVSSPNTDAGCREVLRVYEEFEGSPQVTLYQNASRRVFVNLLRHAQFLIGNSSLGLLEAPSIPLAAINVGSRQRGRLAADSVVFVSSSAKEIRQAIDKVLSAKFKDVLESVVNPHGDGHTVGRIVDLLMDLDYERWLFKREDPLAGEAGLD